MQVACDVIYSRILNTSYILQSKKYSNLPAEFIQTNQQNLFKLYTSIVMVV